MRRRRPPRPAQARRERQRHGASVTHWLLMALDSVVAFGQLQGASRATAEPGLAFAAARRQLLRLAPFHAVGFWVVDGGTGDFTLVDCEPPGAASRLRAEIEAQIGRGVFAWALRHPRVVTTPASEPGETLLLHVLVSGTRVVGMCGGLLRDGARDSTVAATQLLTLVLLSTAQTYDNLTLQQQLAADARALEATVRQRTADLAAALGEAAALLRVGRALAATLEVDEVRRTAIDAVGRVVAPDALAVWELDDGAGEPVMVTGPVPGAVDALGECRLDGAADGLGVVARGRRRPWLMPDGDSRPGLSGAGALPGAHRACLAVPAVARDRVIALVAAVWQDRVPTLGERQLGLLEAIGHQVGAALDNARLHSRVQAAYRDLSETKDRLAQTLKLEAVGRLAGGMAHDFNNLLTVVLGHSELLLHGLGADHPSRRHVDAIRQTSERAATLTRQLLAFSGRQILQPRVLALNAVVGGMEAMLQRLLGEDIELVVTLDPAAGHVRADLAQLEQVVLNLAANARDAMPHGGQLTLRTGQAILDDAFVRAHPGARADVHAVLEVRDTGVGMDATTRERLFEPFFTTKSLGRGSGLGLATVHGIVVQSDGTITVESEPGQGTAFTIYLPRVDDEVALAPESPPAAAATILLVEDEETVRALGREILERAGYQVLEAADGVEALARADEHPGPIDAVVTDVVMPRCGGRELAERLARLRPGTRILYVSGYTEDDVLRRGVLASETAFLHKPFTSAALVESVRRILATPLDGRVAGAPPPGPR